MTTNKRNMAMLDEYLSGGNFLTIAKHYGLSIKTVTHNVHHELYGRAICYDKLFCNNRQSILKFRNTMKRLGLSTKGINAISNRGCASFVDVNDVLLRGSFVGDGVGIKTENSIRHIFKEID